jgi:hypothetical protein
MRAVKGFKLLSLLSLLNYYWIVRVIRVMIDWLVLLGTQKNVTKEIQSIIFCF